MSSEQQPTEPVVLVVEDEPVQLMGLIELVEQTGFGVAYAINVDHAIAMLEAHPSIRVALVDVRLPTSADGLRLTAMVRNRWPPVHIIAMSAGHAPSLADLPADAVFMTKPLNYGRVASTLRDMIAAD